jgi:hypothetical protein
MQATKYTLFAVNQIPKIYPTSLKYTPGKEMAVLRKYPFAEMRRQNAFYTNYLMVMSAPFT